MASKMAKQEVIHHHYHHETSKKRIKKRYTTALLLSIFLGAIGVDRFYLGYVGTGILKLLITIFSLGILGWIWWLIDIILIASKYDFRLVTWV